MIYQVFLARLKGVQPSGDGHIALCPSHRDDRPSLHATDTPQRILVHCFAGCSPEAVCAAMGLTILDLFHDQDDAGATSEGRSAGGTARRIVGTYDYLDERGELLFQVCRYEPKDFRQRRPDGKGGWAWSLKGVRRVIYRMPELKGQRRVLVVEGERDADRAWSLGLAATTNAGGAGKWRLHAQDYATQLIVAGVRELALIPDNDPPGHAHMADVLRSVQEHAPGLIRCRWVDLPGVAAKGDVSAWLDQGHTREELLALVEQAPFVTEPPPNPTASELSAGEPAEATPACPTEPEAFRIVTPPEAFITRYIEYARQTTDAPEAAHELVAVVLLSALAGSRPRLPIATSRRGWRLMLWGLYVVNSTTGRKTTVVDGGEGVAREVLGDAALLHWEGSPQGLLQRMAGRDGLPMLFARDEIAGLLVQMNRGGHLAGLSQLLIRAYDGLPLENVRTRKRSGKGGPAQEDSDRVQDPYLVLLAASTWDSFVQAVTLDNVLDGFVPRFVMMTGSATPRRPALRTPELDAAYQALLDHAQWFWRQASTVDVVQPTDAVLDAYWAFEQVCLARAEQSSRPEAARPVCKRLAEAALKVGALLALDLAPEGERPLVELRHLEAGQAMVNRWLSATLSVVEAIGRTSFQRHAEAVMATVLRHPDGIPQSKLYRLHRDLRKRDFDEVIAALEVQERIVVAKGAADGGGRPPLILKPGPAAREGVAGEGVPSIRSF